MDTVTFIGHSEIYRLDEARLKEVIENCIKQGARLFLNGGMGSFDYACARIVKELQNSGKMD